MIRRQLPQVLVAWAWAAIMPSISGAQQPETRIATDGVTDSVVQNGSLTDEPIIFIGEMTGPSHSPLPPEYIDLAFARYVDLLQVGAAAAANDATQLIDAALQLAEGERILLRTHRSGVTVEMLLRTAVKWSILKQDQASLDRLAKVAESRGDQALQSQLQAAKKLAGATREANSSLTVSLDSTDAETLLDMKRWLDQTRTAAALGDEASLLNVRQAVDEIEGRLNDVSRTAILAEIEGALKAAQQSGAKNDVLIRLAGAARGYETNKFDLKDKVENGGWTVAWADDISETDAINGVAAAGVSIYAGNPAPFYAWIDSLVADTTRSMMKSATKQFPDAVAKQAKQLAADVIKQALRGQNPQEVFKQFDTVDFKAGAIRYSGRNFDKFLGNDITYSRTWGLKPYVAFRWRGSGGNDSPPPTSKPNPQEMIAYSITNASRFTVTLEFSPTGNTARLTPGQTTTARSPVRNGEYPKVTARTSSGKYWIRTIRDQNGAYRIINNHDGGIQIVP